MDPEEPEIGTARLALAFVVASLFALLTMVVMSVTKGDRLNVAALSLLPFIYVYVLLATMICGIPAFFFLLWLRRVTFLWTLIAGALGGALVGSVLRQPAHAMRADIWYCGLIGSAASIGFWVVWKSSHRSTTSRARANDA